MDRRNFLKLASLVPFVGLIPAKKVVAKKLDWRTLTFMKCHKLSTQYPGNVGVIVRDRYQDMRQTMLDFQGVSGMAIDIPSNSVIYPNGSRVIFLHAGNVNCTLNMNLGWFFFDHLDKYPSGCGVYEKLKGRLRRKGVPIHWFRGWGDGGGDRFSHKTYQ